MGRALGLSEEQIEEIFSFHPPKTDQEREAHEEVRAACKQAALTIKRLTPDSPDQTTAIRHLQQAMMYGNAAIAIHS